MLRLVELHVRKFRDLVDGGPLRFGPGPVFLLGPNGSGKTTLLELIGVLLGDDLRPLFREEDAVELSWVLEAEGEGGTTRLEMHLSIDAVPRPSADERTAKRPQRGWSISGRLPARNPQEEAISFEQAPKQRLLVWLASGVKLRLKVPSNLRPSNEDWMFEVALAISAAHHEHGGEIRGADRLYNLNELYSMEPVSRFDEALVKYDQIVGIHEHSIEMADQAGKIGLTDTVPKWLQLTDDDGSTSHDNPDIKLLTNLLGAERIDFDRRLVLQDGRGRRHWRGFDIYVNWGGGAKHHHSELSFGQKRLIALIWQLGIYPELPLLTDEMTNGLHAGWVRAIIDHIGPRQGFHAVQNPLLLDRYGPGERAEDIAGRFVICTVEPGERGRQWRWRSPTPVECERLWQAYLAGFQHLSELLVSEGLW